MFYGFDAKENHIEEEFDGDHHWEDIQNFYEDIKNPSGLFSKSSSLQIFQYNTGHNNNMIS